VGKNVRLFLSDGANVQFNPIGLAVDQNPTPAVVRFNSIFDHGMDTKRRILVPVKWRAEEAAEEALTVVIWRGHAVGICLRVLPPAEMAKLRQAINTTEDLAHRGILKRLVGADSEQVTPDSAGRLLLPERMVKEAGLENGAVLVGQLDYFEIWNPKLYERQRVVDEVMAPAAFKPLN
jgi:MraZ protein